MLAPEFPPAGGIGTRSFESAMNLLREGHRITVLVAMSGRAFDKSRYAGLHVHNISWLNFFKEGSTVRFIVTVLAYTMYTMVFSLSRHINLCYSTIAHAGIASLVVRKLFGKPYLLAIHGMEISSPTRIGIRWLRPVLENAAALTILADSQRQNLRNLGISDKKIFKIPEGIDTSKFYTSSKDQEIMARHSLNGKKIILTVGRLVKRKGQDMIVTALPEIIRQVPDTVYLVVGTGSQQQALMKMTEEKEVSDRVIFAGYVPEKELVSYYSVCDVFAMPSREIGADIEGFGIVYLEANACGKPVIGGKSGGIGDAVEDGFSGILVDPEDPEAIGRAIIRLLTDTDLAEKLGRQGQERVHKDFSYNAAAVRIREMLDKIGLGHNGHR